MRFEVLGETADRFGDGGMGGSEMLAGFPIELRNDARGNAEPAEAFAREPDCGLDTPLSLSDAQDEVGVFQLVHEGAEALGSESGGGERGAEPGFEQRGEADQRVLDEFFGEVRGWGFCGLTTVTAIFLSVQLAGNLYEEIVTNPRSIVSPQPGIRAHAPAWVGRRFAAALVLLAGAVVAKVHLIRSINPRFRDASMPADFLRDSAIHWAWVNGAAIARAAGAPAR